MSKQIGTHHILNNWNQFFLLQQELAEIRPSMTPDDIFRASYAWTINELTAHAEKAMIADEMRLREMARQENEAKNKR